MSWLIVFLVIVILILINSLYVAAEFSAVSSRRARLTQMAEGGNKVALIVLDVIRDPHRLDNYVATCQIGITVSSLVLGYYGQAQLSGVVAPLIERLGATSALAAESISASVVLLALTVLQVLLGELVPKNIGIQYPERLALATLVPLQWSIVIFRPLIWLFNGSGQLIMRIFGLHSVSEHTHIHSPEEITMLVLESSAGGLIDQEEERMLVNTLHMREARVRQVMIPRVKMLAAPTNLGCRTLFTRLADSNYSRLPIYRNTVDNIIGVVHLKDLMCLSHCNEMPDDPEEILHPVSYVPETMPVKQVFSLLQRKHQQVAIVLGEYGGTLGMVTIEDLVEEIFGDLQDEFDTYIPSFMLLDDNRLMISGETLVEDINEVLRSKLPEEDIDTLGGLVLNASDHVPMLEEEVVIGRYAFRVERMEGRAVAAVSIQITPEQAARVRARL
ncbi:MAG: HlyC/CorC family transporter [Anaerolineales bacterium]|nr:HlyC/CorC family transporter [Anaerolineales bacterium]